MRKEHGLEIAEARLAQPKLLLLNILRGFYAVWEAEGQVVGINLIRHDAFVAPRLEDIRSFMPSPAEYMAAKGTTSHSLPQARTGLQGADWGFGEIPDADQMRASWPHKIRDIQGPRKIACGPGAATTIALWKRVFDADCGFPQPPPPRPPQQPPDPRQDIIDIYDGFHLWNMGAATWWNQWRDGFLGYAGYRNEHFTLEARRPGTYWEIVTDIDSGWPLGLMGMMTGPYPYEYTKKPHWVAVEGYFWHTWGDGGSHIIVNDTWWGCCSFTANRRFLCWNALNTPWWLLGPWVIPVRDAD